MGKFVIPFWYLCLSRFSRLSELLSLLCIYPLYLITFIFFLYDQPVLPDILGFLLGFCAWMTMYELGYMENDALTIKKEMHPNIRIKKADIEIIQKNFTRLVLIRITLFLALVSLIFVIALWTLSQSLWFIALVVSANGFFYLHNFFRSRINILTYFGLCVLKYMAFPFLYLGWVFGIEPYIILLVSFPLLRTCEHAVKGKYRLVGLQRFVGSLDSFRVMYYGFALFLALTVWYYSDAPVILVLSLAYFFVFRLGVWVMLMRGAYSRHLHG